MDKGHLMLKQASEKKNIPREDYCHHCDLLRDVSVLIRPSGNIRSQVADVYALYRASKEVFSCERPQSLSSRHNVYMPESKVKQQLKPMAGNTFSQSNLADS